MARHRILALTALAVALVLPATAGAAQRGADSQSRTASKAKAAATTLGAAFAVAQRYWGAMPCNGAVKLLARQPLPAGLGEADAWVTFGSSLGANNLDAPASSYTDCTIAVSASGPWPTAKRMRSDWSMFCTTMTHEFGHLLGHSHDATPGNVMAPVFHDRSSVTSSCRASRPARAGRNHR